MFISFLRRLLADRVFTAHDIPSHTQLPFFVSTNRSNVIPVCCLTVRVRSPRRPLRLRGVGGGTRVRSFVPLLREDARPIETLLLTTFITGFRRWLTPMGTAY